MSAGLALILVTLVIWSWVAGMRARERALAYAKNVCKDLDLQLLDHTVRLGRLRVGRDGSGRVRLRRFYVFEFSTNGADRWYGVAVLLGEVVEYVHLEHPDGPIVRGAEVGVVTDIRKPGRA